MDINKSFSKFLDNLQISNKSTISNRYGTITKVLNKNYWNSDSEILHSLQVGSYGRGTAINGISDLDMVFILPWEVYSRFNAYETNGQSALLQEVKNVISKTYPSTTLKGDGQVVTIKFSGHTVEVLPAFEMDDKSFKHADSNNGGSWKITKPRDEKEEINRFNGEVNNNLKPLCKMIRAWKNKTGVCVGGLLIDTLCYNFFKSTNEYHDKGVLYYDFMVRDFFKFMSDQNTDQTFWYAPGSNQKVFKKDNFIPKAKKAYKACLTAIENESKKRAYSDWKKVFGKHFPSASDMGEAIAQKAFKDTEEFIEDLFPVDIRNSVKIDCTVSQAGFRDKLLSAILKDNRFNNYPLKRNKKLEFRVIETDVLEPYSVRWKVTNVGEVAERKNQIRGQILVDGGYQKRKENSSFYGPHFVECYIIKDGICVARDRIDVPISTDAELD